MKHRSLLIISLFLASAVCCRAAERLATAAGDDADSIAFEPAYHVGQVLYGGDSIPYVEMSNVYIYPEPTFKSKKKKAAYDRLVRDVKTVLPIAKEVNVIVVETYEYMQTIPDKKGRQEYLKFVERSIKEEYTPRMKKLTYRQGKLLIKLVYRECNSSTYQLIRAFLGPVKAGFYQAFAALFGASLKKKYDPDDDDAAIERVVLMVEAGQI